MKIKLWLLASLILIELPTAIVRAQAIVAELSSEAPKEEAESKWLLTNGLWQVTSAKIVENGQASDSKGGPQQFLLFLNDITISIGMPDAEKRFAMSAVGSRVQINGRDKSGTQYMISISKTEQSEMGEPASTLRVRSSFRPTNSTGTTAQLTYLNRRDDGQAWQYTLELEKINDTNRLRELAARMIPHLNETADKTQFGEGRLTNVARGSGQDYHVAIQTWANQALNGSSVGPSTLLKDQSTEPR